MGKKHLKRIAWILLWGWVGLIFAACDPETPTVAQTQTTSSINNSSQVSPTRNASPTVTPTPDLMLTSFKIDTLLSDFAVKYRTSGLGVARQFAHDAGLLDSANQLHFGLTLAQPGDFAVVQAKINQLGGQIFEQYDLQLGIVVNLDVFDKFEKQLLASGSDYWHQLLDLPQVRDIKVLVRPPLTALNTDPNQGVVKTGADSWQQAGYRGQNLKIGIIDGGFKGYQSFVGTAALPPATQLTFKSFLFSGNEGSDEHGVAVAEVVHSYAPAAQLWLVPIEDEIGFAKAVDYLIQNRVSIIQASLGWGGLWPGDGTGLMDSKLDEARKQGVLPIVSAGNYGQSHYMGDLNPDENNYNQFTPGNNLIKIKAQANSAWVALRWDENWNAPQTNLDLFVLDSNHQLLGTSRNVQGNGSTKPPSELVAFSTTPEQTYYVQVRLIGKAATPNLHFHLFAYDATIDNSTAAQSMATPGDAAGAISVGATGWNDDKVEGYSSQGPTQDGRAKPELMAPSGVANLVYGRYNQDFGGTSASAPQVSGLAAVIWSAAPTLSAEQVVRYLERNALPLGDNRPTVTGFGRVKLGSASAVQSGVSALFGPLPSGPVFKDSFNNRGSGLPDDILAYYGLRPDQQPAYFERVGANGLLNWSVYNQADYAEFRAEFGVTPPSGQDFYGLVFWQQNPDNYTALLLSGNQYALLQRDGSNWQYLIPWTSNVALPSKQTEQRVTLEATINYIKVSVGDTLLQNLALGGKGPSKIGGKLGFAVGRFGAGNTLTAPISIATTLANSDSAVVSFNNLVITPLSSK